MYKPLYKNSWALIIGINDYQNVPPLSFAKNDAEAISDILQSNFNFPKENVTLLLDDTATKDGIIDYFLKYTRGNIDKDDRIFVFFAGHGYTQLGKRGEVGYLVPVDGTPDKLSTLVRWDDLTRNADLVPAKHILFIMDACYGGLALTRSPGGGSTRFLKNMLQRYTRQVLTAGKADEVVADSGGPIPEHSVFTGHLLQGMQGKAATKDGIICANGVMAYVYERVSKDHFSRQTPHFGFVDGDGDFIFTAPMLKSLLSSVEEDKDILIEVPVSGLFDRTDESPRKITDIVKEYIPDLKYKIKLDDLVTKELRRFLAKTSDELFAETTANVTDEEFAARLLEYESISKDIQKIVILLARWGGEEHVPVLKKIIARIPDYNKTSGGKVVWLALRYYPSILILYSAGIAAIATEKYDTLYTIFNTTIGPNFSGGKHKEIIKIVVKQLLELQRTNIFKTLPGYEQFYVPKNEYLFKALQPVMDDLLFLGSSYETVFDKFETLLALVYADLDRKDDGRVWGPPGRFAYKHTVGGSEGDPFWGVVDEAMRQGDQWAPLKAGFFGGSIDRFNSISTEYENLISKLGWF